MVAAVLMVETLARSTLALHAAALLLSFALSIAIAKLYAYLHRGVVYSPSFTLTIALAGVVCSVVVLAIGDSIARGLGLVGAVALVRFRSNLKDPLDLIFTFASLANGVACGAQAFGVALLGTTIFIVGALVIARRWLVRAGESFDAILSLTTSADRSQVEALVDVLESESDGYALVRMRQMGGRQEHAYQLKLRRPRARVSLFEALGRIDGLADAQLVAYDSSAES